MNSKCLKCGADVDDRIVWGRYDCSICGLRVFTEDSRPMAFVDVRGANLWVEVPKGYLAVMSWESL